MNTELNMGVARLLYTTFTGIPMKEGFFVSNEGFEPIPLPDYAGSIDEIVKSIRELGWHYAINSQQGWVKVFGYIFEDHHTIEHTVTFGGHGETQSIATALCVALVKAETE